GIDLPALRFPQHALHRVRQELVPRPVALSRCRVQGGQQSLVEVYGDPSLGHRFHPLFSLYVSIARNASMTSLRTFSSLSYPAQVRRMADLAPVALAAYPLSGLRVRLQAH